MDTLTDRLRGKYAIGPHLPNGEPEFGWRQFESPPIQHEAADQIEYLRNGLRLIVESTLDDATAQIASGYLRGTITKEPSMTNPTHLTPVKKALNLEDYKVALQELSAAAVLDGNVSFDEEIQAVAQHLVWLIGERKKSDEVER